MSIHTEHTPVTEHQHTAGETGAVAANHARPVRETGTAREARAPSGWLGKMTLRVWIAGVVVAVSLLWAVAPHWFAPYAPSEAVGPPLEAPSLAHWFGTDGMGRDVFSRVVFGASHSLSAAALAVLVGSTTGTLIGVHAGTTRRWIDDVLLRIVDVLLAIPTLLLSLSVVILLGFGTVNAAIAVGVTSIAIFARLARAQVLTVTHRDYVAAAYGSGGTFWSVLFRHILPNSVAPILSLAALQIGSAILKISTLGFLRYGAPPPTPEWGLLIAEGRNYVATAWWLTTISGAIVVAVVISTHTEPPNQLYKNERRPLMTEHESTLLRISDLTVNYCTQRGVVAALTDVNCEVRAGEITAVVGESGSGKSTLAQAAIGLLPSNGTVVSGSMVLNERKLGSLELMGLPTRRWQDLRGRCVGLVPQDPHLSLHPLQKVGVSISESLRIHDKYSRAEVRERVMKLLDQVGIADPERRAQQYPHEFSGGMRQRALIAAAIANDPELIIADEPTSALDVTVQRTVLDVLDRLRRDTHRDFVSDPRSRSRRRPCRYCRGDA